MDTKALKKIQIKRKRHEEKGVYILKLWLLKKCTQLHVKYEAKFGE